VKPAEGLYRYVFIGLVLLAAGKAILLIGAGQPFPETDMVTYWKMGSQFAKSDWLLREMAIVQWPPGYPAFLGAVQAVFGKYAIVATAALQLLLDFAVALITALICAKVTGRRAGALIGLALSIICISRSCFAVYAMADNLFCVAIALYLLSIVNWLNRPSLRAAAVIGTALAVATLVKSVAQPLCLSTLALMAYKLWQSKCLKKFWPHGGVMLVPLALQLAPWFVRNKILFDHYCLVKFTGRGLWDTCHVSPSQIPVDNSDGPCNRHLRSLLQGTGVDMDKPDSTWPITFALRNKGYSDYEADEIMQAAALESILDHPGQYLAGRPLRFAWFWATPKPFFVVPWGVFYAARDLPLGYHVAIYKSASYVPPGEVTWAAPIWKSASDAFLRVAWHPNSFVFALAALASAAGCVLMARDPFYREAGLAVGSVLLVVSLGTTFFGWPQYRFRMPLEPIMIVTVVPALLSLGKLGKRGSANTSTAHGENTSGPG
jgi:hypothetical protein